MAEKTPSQERLAAIEANKWSSAGGIEIPIDIEPPITALQNFLKQVNKLLEFALFVLDFVKAFVTNFLNPLLAIIKQIITLLKALLQDLRQIGFYITSDITLALTKSEALEGGYPAFERRMVARLTDDQDPNRPDFSNQSSALGIYLYGDSEVSNYAELKRTIMKIINFFRKTGRGNGGLPEATNVRAKNIKIREGLFGPVTGSAVEITWKLGSATVQNAEPVGGYLIEISTEATGFYLGYKGVPEGASSKQAASKTGPQLRTGLIRHLGNNIKIYGGYSLLKDLSWDSKPEEGVQVVLVRSPNDNNVIDPTMIAASGAGTPSQRTFFVPSYAISLDGSKEHRVEIPVEDLPKACVFEDNELKSTNDPTKIYITIRTVDPNTRKKILKEMSVLANPFDPKPIKDPKISLMWDYDKSSRTKPPKTITAEPFNQRSTVRFTVGLEEVEVSNPTKPVAVAVSSVSDDFERVCYNCIALSILWGYDLSEVIDAKDAPVSYENNTFLPNHDPNLVEIMKTVNRAVYGVPDTSDVKKKYQWNVGRGNWSKNLALRIEMTLEECFERMSFPNDLQNALIEKFKLEFEEPFDKPDFHIRDWLDAVGDNPPIYGSFDEMMSDMNRRNRKKQEKFAAKEYAIYRLWYLWGDDGTPIDQTQNAGWTEDELSDREKLLPIQIISEYDPYAEDESDNKNMGQVMDVDPDELTRQFAWYGLNPLSKAQEAYLLTVLNLLFGNRMAMEGGSNWAAYRLFPTGIPVVENAIKKVIDFLEATEEALMAFVKRILDAIKVVEEKIKRIQQIIEMINRLLELLKGFTIELEIPLSCLIHVANGTDGLVTKLITSEEKPETSEPDTKTLGMLIVAGGLPSMLADWIVTTIKEGDE